MGLLDSISHIFILFVSVHIIKAESSIDNFFFIVLKPNSLQLLSHNHISHYFYFQYYRTQNLSSNTQN